MLGKESFGEVYQVGNYLIVRVRPKRRKFKAGARPAFLRLTRAGVFNGIVARAVGIIFCIRSVADNENLNVLEKPATCPKRISAVTIDLIKCLANGDAAPLKLDMNKRKAVYQNSYVVAVIMPRALRGADCILIDDLQAVVMNVVAVNERDVFRQAVVAPQHLNIVFLNLRRLLRNAVIGVGNNRAEKSRPLAVAELVTIKLLKLPAQVCNQFLLRVNRDIIIAALAKNVNKFFFQSGFALIKVGATRCRLVFGYDSIFRCLRHNIEIRQSIFLLKP